MATHKVMDAIIIAAIEGFESQKQHIDAQIVELRQMLDGSPTEPAATPEPPTRKRKISAAARRRMAAGQKKRWAAIKGESEPSSQAAVEAPKPKRRISEEGMKRIIAATKKRWRLAKAAKAQPTTPKKAAPKKFAARKAAAKIPAKGTKKAASAPELTSTAQ